MVNDREDLNVSNIEQLFNLIERNLITLDKKRELFKKRSARKFISLPAFFEPESVPFSWEKAER